MRPFQRLLVAATLAGTTIGASAQYPYTYVITGLVTDCYPGQVVNVQTTGATDPIYNIDIAVDSTTCTFSTILGINSTTATVVMSTLCSGVILSASDSAVFSFVYDSASTYVTFACGALPDCLGTLGGSALPGTPCDDGQPFTYYDTWSPSCVCEGDTMYVDCLGDTLGPAVPGTPCNDGDSLTYNDTWSLACFCQGDSLLIDCEGTLGGIALPGTPCDDGDSLTYYDTWSPFCVCAGTTFVTCNAAFTVQQTTPWNISTINLSTGTAPISYSWWLPDGSTSTATNPSFTFTASGFYGICLTITTADPCSSFACDSIYVDSLGMISTGPILVDCAGIPFGTNLPGTPCDDGNALTTNDTWDSSCQCVGTGGSSPCNADFWVLQAYTYDSLFGTATPIPYVLWVWNLTSGGSGAYTFLWNFGDGTSSTAPYPTHTYSSSGPYALCLTIDDGLGCTDTYCDSITIDTTGYYIPFGGSSSAHIAGFTINVMAPITSGVNETAELQGPVIWPNPVGDEMNVAFVSEDNGPVEVTLLDAQGRVVRSERVNTTGGKTQLALGTHGLDAGIYLLRIANERGSVSQRIVKSN